MSTKQSTSLQTRERLINAAMQTMRDHGVEALTLDSVAREAGVSKGGLLHHFRSKDALVEAILRQLFAEFEALVQRFYDHEHTMPGRWLRAYVRATFADEGLPLEVSAMLLASLTENEALLALIQEDFYGWEERLAKDGIHPTRARVIRLATDAYWVERLMGVEPKGQAERQALMNELLSLIGA